MGYGIDPRSAPRTSGRRSGRHRSSTEPRTARAVVSQRIDAHHRKVHGVQAPRPEGRAAPEGGACLEETARGIGRPGST
jgi:hypothetical protein